MNLGDLRSMVAAIPELAAAFAAAGRDGRPSSRALTLVMPRPPA
jgi:hypothetical protein